jgi:3-deoxy-manno-octulosonate cytidylyltransferase (CMP-KDO synthetase)
MADCLIVIPARLKATRLPDKPLADIGGEPMIVHVWRRAVEADCGPVVVATDSEAVRDAVLLAGGKALITLADHPSGSDRVFETIEKFDPKGDIDIVVNLQGDLPTLDPRLVRSCIAALRAHDADIGTIAAAIVREEERTDPNVVKVVGTPLKGGEVLRALYFTPPYRHLCLPPAGLEAFRVAAAIAARAPREARAAPRDRGRHAHPCRPR